MISKPPLAKTSLASHVHNKTKENWIKHWKQKIDVLKTFQHSNLNAQTSKASSSLLLPCYAAAQGFWDDLGCISRLGMDLRW